MAENPAKPITDIAGALGDFARKIDSPSKAQSTAYPSSMSGVQRANEEVRARAARDLGGPRTPPYSGATKSSKRAPKSGL